MRCSAWRGQQWGCRQPQRHTLLRLLLVAAVACVSVQLSQAHDHAGCGHHHPLVQQQHQQLHRRLQQLRAAEQQQPPSPAAAAASKQQQNGAHQQHMADGPPAAGTSSSSSSSARQSAAAPLRIGVVYQLSGLSPSDTARVKQQLVPAAVKVFQRFIKVRQPSGPLLKLDAMFEDGQQSCLTSRVDASLGTAGMRGTDLVLIVTSDAASCLPGMIAIASACDVDPVSRRPTLGSLNICRESLGGLRVLAAGSSAEAAALGRLVEVLVHEVVHVLGFGSTHFEDWRRPDGRLYGRKNVIQQVGGRPYLVTPRVAAVARSYFGCAALPGAPLENEGPSFSASSHFEFRLLQRELMAPSRPIDRSRTRLSAFTLAALEDSGWYETDTDAAEVLDWGRGAGCDFVLQSCWDFMLRHPGQPFYCGKGATNATRCTAEARGWGVCRANAFSDGCLLVGKYATSSAVAVPAGVAPAADDGRQAACYQPPQLLQQKQQQPAERGGRQREQQQQELVPLLGGSFSARPSDICYNLLRPKQDDVTWVNGHGSLPEDSWPKGQQPGAAASPQQQQQPLWQESAANLAATAAAAAAAAAAGGGGGGSSSGSESERPGDSARAAARLRYSYMDDISRYDEVAAACVNVADGAAATATSSESASSSSSSSSSSNASGELPRAAGRRLLGRLTALLSSSVSSSSRRLAAAAARSRLAAASRRAAVAAVAAVQRRSSITAAVAIDPQRAERARSGATASPVAAAAAACTSSPVLCFQSSCTAAGQLWITVQPSSTAGSSNGSSQTHSFACPSGATVDLSKAVPGLYLLGFLQCPSNALVCEGMGCGECSPVGGYCSRGKCHCHMERYGPGCANSLIPKL